MSLAAYIWACNLPLQACSGTAFRVLLHYADRADELGRTAWVNTDDVADYLGCSSRTVQRARSELVGVGLMRHGDQRYVSHLPANIRPTVYDILTPALKVHERGDIYVTP